jgi:CheY-like chemotaxis protein
LDAWLAGAIPLSLEPACPRSLLDRVISAHRIKFRNSGVLLTAECDPTVPATVRMDETRITQVVSDLLENARRFTPPGGIVNIKMFLTADRQDSPRQPRTMLSNVGSSTTYMASGHRNSPLQSRGLSIHSGRSVDSYRIVPLNCLRIEVADNGVGMTRELQQRLFVPFQRLDSQWGRKNGTTGLTLAINRRIVELHGGSISCKSEPGKGSVFAITIPTAGGSSSTSSPSSTTSPPSRYAVLPCRDPIGRGRLGQIPDDSPVNVPTEVESSDSSVVPIPSSLNPGYVLEPVPVPVPVPVHVPVMPLSRNMEALFNRSINRTSSLPAGETGTPSNANMNVVTHAIVVDDVPSNAMYLEKILRRRGVQHVWTAGDGEDALNKFEHHPEYANAVWFVDKNMPVMDGMELVRNLRGAGVRSLLIGVTADSLPVDLQAFMAAGLSTVLAKPCSVLQLERALHSCGYAFPHATGIAATPPAT